MEIQVAGTLYWGDLQYDLADPYPVLDKGDDGVWMKDSDEKFRVIKFGRVYEVIVSRPFLVSRVNMGKMIKIDEEDAEIPEDIKKVRELFQSALAAN